MSLEIQIRSVKELTNEIKNTLEGQFPYVWVKGEVGSVKVHSSGHTYFSLKEDDYVINAIAWKGTALSCSLEEGMLVECYAKVTIFGGRSSYQIIVKEAREVSKQGNILFELEKLKQKLIQEGVFDFKSSESICEFPEKIAILTSPTGAVLHDMLHRLNDRFPCAHVLFFPISVQGSESKKSILNGLTLAEETDADVVILARGGGSLEDLWIFNDEDIVRKVAMLKLPIISAIGHETDTTLVDFAANLRAPTPTAAIELAVPDKNELIRNLNLQVHSNVNYFQERVNYSKNFLEQFSDYENLYRGAIENFSQRVDNYVFSFIDSIKNRIKNAELVLAQKDSLTYLFEKIETDVLNQYVSAYNTALMRVKEMNVLIEKDGIFIEEKENDLKEKVIMRDLNNNRLLTFQDIKNLNYADFCMNFIDGSVLVSEK